MLVKATDPDTVPVDVGGRILAPGETADLDPTNPTVADHLASGRLTAVQGVPEPPAKTRVPRQTTPEES